ncbi:RMD1 family protein [Bradyrhizobium sp. LHD-71]|jgi:uncharacterized Rmd1/YagE family protein|uniref:RMD1 family protein n=1 Tax=Bradyrhizobium sp. LHD-71 TaxID=3072141 RepID=UPI00280D77AA|nr:RMD1 family protein [Bradyrhizobium sp. LHD-71]MDQ8730222.1 RMD1 family protein [Bradyrhizobium sp. LHD-71]
MLDTVAPKTSPEVQAPTRVAVRAFYVGERIDTTGFRSEDVISSSPLALKLKGGRIAVLFRYGVVVLVGFDGSGEHAFLQALAPRIQNPKPTFEEETIGVELRDDPTDTVRPGGPICLNSLSHDRILLIADALAKSTLLAHIEHVVGAVFDVIDPHARSLAETGRAPRKRTEMLKIIGNALLVHQQVSGRVAISEKPDALWDRPDLERLYERLADEFELVERVEALERKLTVITVTANALTDLIDTRRSLRLEWAIVLLIVFEVIMTIYQLAFGGGH